MQKIHFKRKYEQKLFGQSRLKLLDIAIMTAHVDNKRLKDYFEYDFCGHKPELDGRVFYMLIFVGDKGIPVLTLRKRNKENHDKYAQNREGDWYKVVIDEDIE